MKNGLSLAAGLLALPALALLSGLALAQTAPVPPANAPATVAPATVAPSAIVPAAPAPGVTAAAPITPSGPATMMFTADEVAAIRAAVVDFKSGHIDVGPSADDSSISDLTTPQSQQGPVKPKVIKLPNIYVSAVMDLGGGNWTVWANGFRIQPNAQPPYFKVLAVSGDNIQIVVPSLNNSKFSIRPYQTWIADRKGVVEGLVP